jgi:hypothetical protein
VVLIGLAVVGERDLFGTAHLTLIPIEALGLTLIAASFPWKRTVAIAVLAGCAIDFGCGIYLQARMEALENEPGRDVFTVAMNPVSGRLQPGPGTPETLTVAAWENWYWKHRFELDNQFMALLRSNQLGSEFSLVKTNIEVDLRDDATVWRNWWARHGYRLDFLGDDLALASAAFPPALLVMFAGLMTALLRRSLWQNKVQVLRKAAPRRGRSSKAR